MCKNSFQSSRSLSWNKDLLLHVNPYIRHKRMYIPNEYCSYLSAIQIPFEYCTIRRHLNTELVTRKVNYSDDSVIQMSDIWIPTGEF